MGKEIITRIKSSNKYQQSDLPEYIPNQLRFNFYTYYTYQFERNSYIYMLKKNNKPNKSINLLKKKMKQQREWNEDFILLKQSFCEFFIKMLPCIPDPLSLIRQRWHLFRDVLLDEYKTPKEIYEFVQSMKFGRSTKIEESSDQKNNLKQPQPSSIQSSNETQEISTKPLKAMVPAMRRFSEQQQLNIQIPQLHQASNNLIIKQPSKRKLFDNNIQQTKQQYEQIHRVEYQGLASNGKKLGQVLFIIKELSEEKEFFLEDNITIKIIQKLKTEIVDNIDIFRKHTVTLGCVYDRSFEINTSDLDAERELKLASVLPIYIYISKQQFDQLARQAQQDLLQLQNVQRAMTLKGYSIYAKQDKKDIEQLSKAIKQQQEVTQNQEQKLDKKKIYV